MKQGIEFMENVDKLDKEQRDEFASIISKLIRCFLEEDTKAMIMFKDDSPLTQVMALNCSEMDGMQMIQGLEGYLEFKNMEDAPPKELFN
jgi:hypothetical protein